MAAMAPTTTTRPETICVSLNDLSKMIDHSLLHPTLTDEDVMAGLKLSKKYNVATGTDSLAPKHSLQTQSNLNA